MLVNSKGLNAYCDKVLIFWYLIHVNIFYLPCDRLQDHLDLRQYCCENLEKQNLIKLTYFSSCMLCLQNKDSYVAAKSLKILRKK